MVSLVTGTPVFYDRTASGSSFSFTVNKPANAVTGDGLIFVVVAYGANMPGITAATGWVRAYHDQDSWAGYSIYTHTVTDVDPASWSFASGGGAAGGAWLFGVHGQNPSGGFLGGDVQALLGTSALNNVDPTHLQVPNFTTARNNDLGIIAYGATAIASSASFPIANTETPAAAALPSGWTDAGSSSANESHSGGKTLQINETGAATKIIAAAGAQSSLDIGFADFLRWYGPSAAGVSLAFSVLSPPPPTITSISPASGAAAGGATVTIKGTLLTGTSAITFGGSSATSVTVIDDNNVTCVVPAHAAGAVDVVLTATAGSITSTGGFTYGAPTITALSLAKSPLAGGVSTTITGTNFATGATVTIDGVSCTSVVVVSSTVITCVVPAGTAGAKDVVVTSGDSATLAGGFTYVDAYDNLVKLVKAGSVAGNSKASATHWGVTDEWVSYGGAQDLWGTTLSPSDVNNASFGAAVSAVAGSGATAKVTAMRITVYYTVPGISDAASYVVALQVDPTKTIAKPYVYKLPRADLTVANDPNISLARDDAQFYTSRYPQPSRNVQKTYREVEFWLDASPQTNTPGLQVWAALDEAAAYQLNDNTGAAGTFRTTGPQRAFFPASASAVGHYCQLVFKVPAKAQGEVDVAVSLRDIVIRGALDPITTDLITATFVLGGGEFEDKTSQRKSAKAQLTALKALADPTGAPVAYRDPWGGTGYLKVARVDTKEATYKGATQSVMLANVTLRVMEYA